MLKVKDIAEIINGKVMGDGNIDIHGVEPINRAGKNDISFAVSEEQIKGIDVSSAGCVIVASEEIKSTKTIIKVKDIKQAVTKAYNALLKHTTIEHEGIHPRAIVSEKAKLPQNITVGANAVIEDGVSIGEGAFIGVGCFIGKNTQIGTNVYLNPNVNIYKETVIGDRVIIHSGAVIGADGFGYVPVNGDIFKVPQLGKVIIGNNVEIGANTCIDRGTFEETVIADNVKIDNLVQIAHNVKIGENTLVAGLSGIAGSAKVGKNCLVGGMVGISDHIEVGDNVKLGGKTAVVGKVKANGTYFGYPHREAREALKLYGMMSLILQKSKKLRQLLKD